MSVVLGAGWQRCWGNRECRVEPDLSNDASGTGRLFCWRRLVRGRFFCPNCEQLSQIGVELGLSARRWRFRAAFQGGVRPLSSGDWALRAGDRAGGLGDGGGRID